MLKIHISYRYDFWKRRSITKRILSLAVTPGETESARHVNLVVGAKYSIQIVYIVFFFLFYCV